MKQIKPSQSEFLIALKFLIDGCKCWSYERWGESAEADKSAAMVLLYIENIEKLLRRAIKHTAYGKAAYAAESRYAKLQKRMIEGPLSVSEMNDILTFSVKEDIDDLKAASKALREAKKKGTVPLEEICSPKAKKKQRC